MKQISKVIIYKDKPTYNIVTPHQEKTKCRATRSTVACGTMQKLIEDTGVLGQTIYTYYVKKQHVPGFLFTDKQTSRALSIPIRKVAEARRKLVRAGWFLQYNLCFDKRKDSYVICTILGKENVVEYLKNKPTREDNLKEMFG